MFGLLRNWRRARMLASGAIPDARWTVVAGAIPALSRLNAADARGLRDLTLLFLHEKQITPAADLKLTEAMRLRIAVLACVPILELGLDCYDGFAEVIVYPGEFVVHDRAHHDYAGVVHVGDEVLSGEAWEQGPIVLSWPDVAASGLGTGFDVVAHEFAHKLDLLNGTINGMPPLHAGMNAGDWSAQFKAAYDELQACLDRGEDPWIDPYAAEEPGEFFAVCTELFFDVPAKFRDRYPALYAQLSAYYRQDPSASA